MRACWWIVLAGCGGAGTAIDAAPAPDAMIDAAEIDATEIDAVAIDATEIDAAAIDAAVDAPIDAPTPCTTYGGVWQTNAATFTTQIAPAAILDFEHRADGVTGVTAGVPVPPDEYLACCGVRIDYVGAAGGRVVWAGNAVSGFSVRSTCLSGPCNFVAGIRLTFVPSATAAGADYGGGTNATAYDAAGALVSSMSVMGSGTNFLGYQGAVRLDHVEYADFGGEDLPRLVYHRCAP